MMENQLEIDFAARVRRTDVQTSRDAAASAEEFGHTHHALILEALSIGDGKIYDIAHRTGIAVNGVARRMKELQKHGRADRTGETRPGDTNRMCAVWRKTNQPNERG